MNSAKRPQGKTSKNNVGVQAVKGYIRLSLPREVSRAAYGVEQKFISPGLPATPVNLKLMQSRADWMSTDIQTGNFDVTWAKYELNVVAANKLTSIDGGKKAEVGLLELWEKFKEYKRPSLAETTFVKVWQGTYTRYIAKAVSHTDGSGIQIRNYLISNINTNSVKEILSALSFAYQWGIQHELTTKNPFLGMSQEIEVKKKQKAVGENWDENEDIRAFSLEEAAAIIEHFETTPSISHWANYVKILFWTGCRPGEAAALRWKHIKSDCNKIVFEESYDRETRITKATKTETARIFPCNTKLKSFLLSIRPENYKNDDLIFTSKGKRQVDLSSLGRLWRGNDKNRQPSVINKLVAQGKVRQYLKLYATRHTFISAQVDGGVDAHVIAAWVGNSADIIWKHYYQHKQNQIPVPM